MAIPYYTHSGMAGAPQFSTAARSTPDVLAAVLVNGFNVQAPTSAVASGGVLTLNYSSAHGYEALCHITVSGASVAAANGTWRVATVPAGNQLTCTIAGLPDGAVGGTISTKVAGAGWTEPFAPDATTRVFRMAGGNQRYLRVYRAASAVAFGRGYEDMTGLDTGTDPFPTVAQASGQGIGLFQAHNPTATDQWWALAAPNGVYFSVLTNTGSGRGVTGFFDLAEPVKAGDSFSTCFFGAPTGNCWISRSHTGVSGSVIANPFPSVNPISLTVPSPISEGTRLIFGVPVTAVSTLRGLLPLAFNMLPPQPNAGAGVVFSSVINISGRARVICGQGGTGQIAVPLDEDWPA